jgi:hypothetical protein
MQPDKSQIEKLQENLITSVRRLQKLAVLVGSARQIKEFSSDQRKNALAAEQIKFIQRGESVAGAEVCARSSPVYAEKISKLERDYSDAEKTIAQWQADFAYYEACRSLLAMERETMRTLEG